MNTLGFATITKTSQCQSSTALLSNLPLIVVVSAEDTAVVLEGITVIEVTVVLEVAVFVFGVMMAVVFTGSHGGWSRKSYHHRRQNSTYHNNQK